MILKMIPKPYLIAALLVSLAGSYGYGFHKGTVNQIKKQEAAKAALQQDVFDLTNTLSVKNAEILALAKEREELINGLEEEAINAVGSDAPGVGSTGGLQRLERRWDRNP